MWNGRFGWGTRFGCTMWVNKAVTGRNNYTTAGLKFIVTAKATHGSRSRPCNDTGRPLGGRHRRRGACACNARSGAGPQAEPILGILRRGPWRLSCWLCRCSSPPLACCMSSARAVAARWYAPCSARTARVFGCRTASAASAGMARTGRCASPTCCAMHNTLPTAVMTGSRPPSSGCCCGPSPSVGGATCCATAPCANTVPDLDRRLDRVLALPR